MKEQKEKDNALGIFLKNPEIGKVKTRIAQGSSDEKALEIYHQLITSTIKNASNADCTLVAFYSNHLQVELATPAKQHLLQSGNGLGEKLKNALRELEQTGFEKKMIIGSDCPYITSEIINEAFDSLEENDLVVGPTFDGGYYLIGMKSIHKPLFENIQWSTEYVFGETIEKAKKLNLKIWSLKKLSDIDYFEDWERYINTLR